MFLTIMLLLGFLPAGHPVNNPDQWSKSFSVDGAATLRVQTGDANIHISGSEGGTIEARVTTENWKIGGDGIQIIDRQTGNQV